jgi:3-carboxy-cis,cis-muconate cycloisomerase
MYDPLFGTTEATHALADRAFFRAMLRFEQALSAALEATGEVPAGAAAALAQVDADALDYAQIALDGAAAGNVCIPFVKALTVAVARIDVEAAAYVHWGATSQDVIDTALLLQLRDVWQMMERDLASTCAALAERIVALRATVMPGRTWLQQGPPVTMGLKLATWLDALQRHRERRRDAATRIFALQFGGAVGTLAPLGNRGVTVSVELAQRLELTLPDIPWHTQRDRIAEFATVLAMLVGTCGKIGRDVSLLMQTEVAEFLEPAGEGRGGSSTMPHKRNPVGCAVMLSAAVRVPGLAATVLSAMVQEHERGLGGWHAEWETVAEIARLAAGSLAQTFAIAPGATADATAMHGNLDRLHGVTMAESVSFVLAKKIGRSNAHHVMERASKRALADGVPLHEALQNEPQAMEHLSVKELAAALDPSHYLGSTQLFIDAVLSRHAKGGL